jgi:hypothetical protein
VKTCIHVLELEKILPRGPKLYKLRPGNFPDNIVHKTLGIEVEPGEVIFSVPAQNHANRNHPGDAALIIPHLSQVIEDPMYVGDDFNNVGKIELVRMIPNSVGQSAFALVAVTVEMDSKGFYNICSSYLITQSEVDKKRNKGILKNVKVK